MADETQPAVGMTVYAADGTELGSIHGFGDDGFFVMTREGLAGMSVGHKRAGRELSETELMWRCSDCGEIDNLDELSDTCPSCGAERGQLYYWAKG